MTIRIARILGRSNVGGPTRTVLHLTRHLAAEGFETLLIVGHPGEREGELIPRDEPAVVRLPGLRRSLGWSDLRALRLLRKILEEFRPHIVHTHAAKAGALGRRAALGLKARPIVVHTFHGHVLDSYFPKVVSLLFRQLERRLARSTDCLVAVSASDAKELSETHALAGPELFEVIENGIDLAPFRPPDAALRQAGRLRLGADDRARLILVPARLAPIKQHRLLFDALDRLPAAVLPVEVHLLGDGPLRKDLERRASKLREGVAVRFHGFRDDLPAVLPAADLVALSSRREGMPLALIEAMAAGVPVVATAVGGVPELVLPGKTGLLVPDGDIGSLAFALGRVLSDLQLARRLGLAGRQRALERHGLDRVVREHAELYRRLLRTRSCEPFAC
ncbi:MAG: glycosyltransferase family 4 protein [Planctomycetota bacterium]